MTNENSFGGYATTLDGDHVTLDAETAEALWAACEASERERKALMPDMQAALSVRGQVYARLRDFGWREGMYCPKGGEDFAAILQGSSGIFPACYVGRWPTGSISVMGDEYSHAAILWKPVDDLDDYERQRLAECVDMERRAADAEVRRFARMAQHEKE